MLVFLDIDGVMVPAKSWESPKLLGDGFPDFSDKAVCVLQKVVSGDSTIMLTTSHKSRFSVEEWKVIFAARGIYVKNLGKLEQSPIGTSRRSEILNWFNINDINEDFIIIDDDKSLNALPSFLKENLILTSSMVGLNDSHLEDIKAIMEKHSPKI
jgi:hypothetical protein